MRNWPYAWALANAAGQPDQGQGRRGARCPRAAPTASTPATLGGWQLAVSKYSQEPGRAADLVALHDQRRGAEAARDQGLVQPDHRSLYKDPDVLAAVPFFGSLYDGRSRARWRGPSQVTGAKYNQVSSEFFNAVHEVLTARREAPTRRWPLSSKKLDRAVPRRQAGRQDASRGRRVSWLRPGRARRQGHRQRATEPQRRRHCRRAPERASRLTRSGCAPPGCSWRRCSWCWPLVAGWPLARTICFSFTDANLSDLERGQFIGIDNFYLSAARPGLVGRASGTRSCSPPSRSSSRPCWASASHWRSTPISRGRGLLRAAVLIPWAIPTVVSRPRCGRWMFNDVFGVHQRHAHGARHLIASRSPGPPIADTALVGGDHRRCLEDDAVHGAADAGRPADAAERMLRGGARRRRPPASGCSGR